MDQRLFNIGAMCKLSNCFPSNQSILCFISTVKLSELNFRRRVEVELMNVFFSPFFIAFLLEQLNTLVSSADVGFTECSLAVEAKHTTHCSGFALSDRFLQNRTE